MDWDIYTTYTYICKGDWVYFVLAVLFWIHWMSIILIGSVFFFFFMYTGLQPIEWIGTRCIFGKGDI